MTTETTLNSTAKQPFVFTGIISLVLIVIIGILGYTLFMRDTAWSQLEQERTEIRLKVEELRQSSDNLTRFIRLYALTNRQEYIDNYFEIINIRDGAVSRPSQYHNVYWDLPPETRAVRHPPEAKEVLIDVLKSLNVSERDRKLLADSFDNSQSLATIEKAVFAVLENPTSDVLTKEESRQRLFSSDYQDAKVRIMRPINTVLSNIEQDNITDTAIYQASIRNLAIMFGVAFVLLFVVMAFQIRLCLTKS